MNHSIPSTSTYEHSAEQITSSLIAFTIPYVVSTTTIPSPVPSTSSAGSNQATVSLGVRITVITYCYILPCICVLGIIGNLMNVVTLASRRLRAVSYMYLRALAIADLLCMIYVMAFVTGEILLYMGFSLNRYYWYGIYQAHFMLSFINWALATGVYVVVALSLERYISIVFPLHFRAWNSPQRASKAIVAAYIIPACFYIPYAIGRYSIGEKTTVEGHTIYMAIDSEISKTIGWQIYKWTREALLRFVPIMVLSILNFQIMLAFRRRQQMFSRLTNREQQGASRDDTILYILSGIVVMFFVCNIPAALNLLFINEIVKKRVDYQIFRAVANLLEITNHAAQFYIFCVCSTDYRVTFMQKFPFPCFKEYYINKKKFCSFMKRNPKDSMGNFPSKTNSSVKNVKLKHHQQYKKSNSGGGGDGPNSKITKQSTTATIEMGSTTCGQPHDLGATIPSNSSGTTIGEQQRNANGNNVDIHLASGEEDISDDESEILLHHAVLTNSLTRPNTNHNGTTFL